MPGRRFHPAVLTLPLLAALAPLAHAADTPPATPAPATDLAGSVGQMLFGLAVVIALLLGCLWLLKRVAAPRGAASAMKVLGAVPVGPRERVVLVEVGSEVLVLGVAPGNVRTLHIVPAASLPAAPAAMAGSPLAGKDFSAWLKQSLERRKDAP